MSCHKGDRLSQSRPGYKLVVLVLPTCLFTVFILLFIYYYYFSTPTVFTRRNWCWIHDDERTLLHRENLWLRLRKSCTSNKLFNLDLVLFIYLFAYLFLFSTVHSLFPRKLTLDTWWWNNPLARENLWLRSRKPCTNNKFFLKFWPCSVHLTLCLIIYFLYRPQSFSAETDTGYVMMNGASCPERTYDYAYANPVEMTSPSLISSQVKSIFI